MQQLISEGADIFDGHHRNALVVAEIAVLIQSEAELLQALITANNIDIAISAKQAANIVHLLLHGVKVRDNGEIVAGIAATKEDYALAAILLKAAVGIKGRDENGWTPLLWAVLSEDWTLVQQLLSEDADIFTYPQNALNVAVLMQRETEFIEIFTSIDSASDYVEKMLIYATAKRYAKAVKVLLEHGVNPNAEDNFGHTVLQHTSDADIADMLLKHGANPNIKGIDGNYLWKVVTRRGRTGVVELLYIKHQDNRDDHQSNADAG